MARYFLRAICLSALLLVVAGQPNVVNTYSNGVQTPGSVTSCDINKDYFPSKMPAVFAKFSVEYKLYYKIVSVGQPVTKKYLLVQRGCPVPVGVSADVTLTIPLTSVALGSQTWHKFVEANGERGAIKGVNGLYSASPCINKLMTQDALIDLDAYKYSNELGYYTEGKDAQGNITKVSNSQLTNSIEAHFIDGVWMMGKNGIIIGDNQESTFQAMNEWIQYVALFFNREYKVDDFTSKSRQKWICHSKSADNKDDLKAVVLNYLDTDYGEGSPKGWIISTCNKNTDPSYRYCDLIKAAGGLPITAFSGSKTTSPSLYDKGNGQLLGVSDADVVAYASSADVIIIINQYCSSFTNTDGVTKCDAYWNAVLAKLGGTKAHTNKKIYDNGRRQDPTGGPATFEAVVEPEVLLQDMIKVLNPSLETKHKLVFLRNMFMEGTGNQRPCISYPTAVGCIPDRAQLAAACPDPYDSNFEVLSEECSAASSLLPYFYKVAFAVAAVLVLL